MLNSHLEHTHEDNDHKGINFFQYKRNIESLTNQFIENKWFLDQDQMKEFIYNQNQENPDGIIMEVNTWNVGWPGMIEVIDQADISYMKAFSQNPYAELIKELQVLSMHENTVKYFEKYILSELQNKNAEKIILVFATDKEISWGPESIGLDSGYSDYIPLKAFQKLIKYKKNKLDTTLIMNYGLSYTYRAHKNYEVFLKTFQDRYLNQENEAFSSKLWSNILWREYLTGRCISKKKISKKHIRTMKILETNFWIR